MEAKADPIYIEYLTRLKTGEADLENADSDTVPGVKIFPAFQHVVTQYEPYKSRIKHIKDTVGNLDQKQVFAIMSLSV